MDKNNRKRPPFATLKAYFKREGFDFYNGRFPKELAVSAAGKHLSLEHFVHIDDELGLIHCRTYFPVIIPIDRRPEIAELICRANCYAEFGRFQMTFDHGTLFFVTSSVIENDKLSDEVIEGIFYENHHETDVRFMAIFKVLFARTPIKDAFKPEIGSIDAATLPAINEVSDWSHGDGPNWAR